MNVSKYLDIRENHPDLAGQLDVILRKYNTSYLYADICTNCGHTTLFENLKNCPSEGRLKPHIRTAGSLSCPACGNPFKNYAWYNYLHAMENTKPSHKYANNPFAWEDNRTMLGTWYVSMGCPHIRMTSKILTLNENGEKAVAEVTHEEQLAIVFDIDNQIVYEVCERDHLRPLLYRAVLEALNNFTEVLKYQSKNLESVSEVIIEDYCSECVDLTASQMQIFTVALNNKEATLVPYSKGKILPHDTYMRLCAYMMDYVARSYTSEVARILVGHEFRKIIKKTLSDSLAQTAMQDLKYISFKDEKIRGLIKHKEFLEPSDGETDYVVQLPDDETADVVLDETVYSRSDGNVVSIIGRLLYEHFHSVWDINIYHGHKKPHKNEEKETKQELITKKIILSPNNIMLPQDIKKYLDKKIYKQDDACKAAAVMLYNHILGRSQHIMFVGPSGVGKTEIFRVLKEIYPYICIIDSSRITTEGFKGEYKAHSIFESLLRNQVPQEEIEHTIFVLDEFDKFCRPMHTAHGENHSAERQGELLKIVENDEVMLDDLGTINTSKISFAFCGAFEFIRSQKSEEKHVGFGEDRVRPVINNIDDITFNERELIEAGVVPELLGRIDGYVELQPFDKNDMEYMLRYGPNGTGLIEEVEKTYNVKLRLTDEEIKRYAIRASENRMGIRNLRNMLKMRCNDLVYENNG